MPAEAAREVVRPVTFGVVDHLDVPLTVGFWRPVVLLPGVEVGVATSTQPKCGNG